MNAMKTRSKVPDKKTGSACSRSAQSLRDIARTVSPQWADRAAWLQKEQKDTGGFTLLELLTATAISSMLVIMLLGVFNQASKAWTAGEDQTEVYQTARAVLDLMARDFSENRTIRRYEFMGDTNSVAFYTAVGLSTGRTDVMYVEYEWLPFARTLKRTKKNHVLDPNSVQEVRYLLRSNLFNFGITYYVCDRKGHRLVARPQYYSYLQPQPNTNTAPAAVEVSFSLISDRAAAAIAANPNSLPNVTNASLRTFRQLMYLPSSVP
jgi:type II secretory pathway component PulJ